MIQVNYTGEQHRGGTLLRGIPEQDTGRAARNLLRRHGFGYCRFSRMWYRPDGTPRLAEQVAAALTVLGYQVSLEPF